MNYALVSGAVVDVGEASSKQDQNGRSSLTQLLERYAVDHPNPRLQQEYQQRDALLQQVAAQEVDRNPSLLKKSKNSGGFFGFLFSKRAKHDDNDEEGMYDTSLLNEDEWLEYNTDQQHENETESLCDSTLDTSCIPQEAYSIIRFFCSCRRNVPNVARTQADNGSNGNIVTLVSLGVVCELYSETGQGTVMETSDRQALQEYVAATSSLREYDVSQARAVVLGDGLLAVSWGFHDGLTVLYQGYEHGWNSIAVISPTRAVSDNIQHGASFTMLVTDLVVMQVQDPMDPSGVVKTLAISRLGGYIEFVVVPPAFLSHTSSTRHGRTAHKRKRGSHHYAADLPNISYSETGMTALTTMEYHVDVLCLQVHRTNVGSDTEWDTNAFPKTPPAEYVLVATGGTQEGRQVVSFWGVSIVFPETGNESPSIHVAFLDGINVGKVGADSTLFCSEKMWQQWRKPRQVRLRARRQDGSIEEATMDELGDASEKQEASLMEVSPESKRLPLSTLSAAMPIVRMRIRSGDSEVVLAALDGNGGVAFIDCTAVIALAAHDVTEEELGDESLVRMKCRLPSKRTSATVDIGWLNVDTPSKVDDEVFYDYGCSPLLSLVAVKPRMLQLISLPLSSSSKARVSYSLDLPSVSYGANIVGNSSGQSISFVALRTTKDRRSLLCEANLERLDSSTVIAMLVKAKKYEEAIAAADAMNVSSSSDTIQSCHKQLWKQNGDIRHLAAVTDDAYVVNEALSMFDDSDKQKQLDLSTARAACLLALERAGGVENAQDTVLRLEALEAKVSTYILLCMGHEAVPDLVQFRDKFLAVSLPQLASAFASKGDVPALTMIMFRHRPELLPCQLEILDCLPLETPPESFAHLLPVLRPGKACFHTGEHGINGLHQWPMLAHYMENTHDVRLLLDDKDESAILDRCRLFDEAESTVQASSIRKWYLTRAKRIQSELGSISLLRQLFELASLRLDVSLDSIPGEQVDPDVREFRALYAYVVQLNQILSVASSSVAAEKLVTNALATMSLSDIGNMAPEDRVTLILGPPIDPGTVISKFRNGSMFLSLGEQTNDDDYTIDQAVSAYCRSAISNAVVDDAENGSLGFQRADALRNALDVCTEIANASRSTIRRSNRVIKNKTALMDLVLNAAYDTSRACKLTGLSPSDCRHLVDSIWESYECLPIRLSPDDASQDDVQVAVDLLYKNLAVVDILSRWSSSALNFLIDLKVTDCDDTRGGRVAVGLAIATKICQSFCHRLSQGHHPNTEVELELLSDLLSDFDQLDKVGFDSGLPITRILQEHLVKPLLQQERFHLIGTLANWRDRNATQATVLAFVNETMFSDGNGESATIGTMNGDRIQAAIGCQDILGPLFPDLRDEFVSSRRYLDAASFVNRMMAESNEFVLPWEVRDKPPLDIVESLLRTNPGCILDGCRDWMNPAFSRKANETICRRYLSMEDGNAEDISAGATLPVLPGSAVYHLASLLRLQGPRTLLVVKARVVYHAILISEYAAAAAVCATMAYEKEPPWDEPAVVECIVDAVARVVCLNDYDDVQMKLALCHAVFKRDRGTLSVLDFQAYEPVLDSFVMLENITSRRRRPQAADLPVVGSRADHVPGSDELPTVNDFLVFRAVGMVAKTAKNVARHRQAHHQPESQASNLIGPPPSLTDRVYQDILTQYSTDMRELFWILRGVSASSRVDDPLLLTLGRLLGFWCIADALRIRPQNVPLGPERADLDDVLSLGISLLLHTQNREELVSCIGELQGILARETVATMERVASTAQPDSVTPDPEIVQTLISRGYSENGARRAAIMTGNESAQVALVWAVSHTLDEGFDDPMVSVASQNGFFDSGRVDQSMIHCLQETLNLANSYVSRKQSLQSLLPATQSLTKLLGNGETRSNGCLQNGHGHGSKSASQQKPKAEQPRAMAVDKQKSKPVGKPAAKTTPAQAPQKMAKSNLVVPPLVEKGETKMPDIVGAPTASVGSLKVVPPKPPAPTRASQKLPRTSVPAEKRGNGTMTSVDKPKSAVPAPSAPRSQSTPATSKTLASSSVDRLPTLRSHDKNKSTGTNLASDERQRLIAEGRRMLREARASRSTTTNTTAASAAVDTAKATSSRYPLRSRTTASSAATATATPQDSAAVASARIEATISPPAPAEDTKKDDNDDDDGWDFDDF